MVRYPLAIRSITYDSKKVKTPKRQSAMPCIGAKNSHEIIFEETVRVTIDAEVNLLTKENQFILYWAETPYGKPRQKARGAARSSN